MTTSTLRPTAARPTTDSPTPVLPARAGRRGPDRPTRAGRLGRSWDRATGPQRLLYGLGVVLVLSGLFHLGVQVVDGGAWAGPVSWRKPVVFGLSLGLLNLTLAWILGAFSLRPRAAWAIVAALGVGSVAETFLIAMQRWRGVASHFNDTTSFDGAVWMAMGMAISLVVVPTAVLLVRSLGPLKATPSRTLAIRAGLALLLAGYVVGGFMMLAGPDGATALAPTHALALHGLQALLLADVLVGRTRRSPRGRARAVTAASVTWTALVVASLAV